MSPLPSYSLQYCFRGHTAPPPPPLKTYSTLTTPWQQGHEAWHHARTEPITSLSSFSVPSPSCLLPPPPPPPPPSIMTTQLLSPPGHTEVEPMLSAGEVRALTKPDWTSAGKEEDHAVSLDVDWEGEGRVTKTGERQTGMGERKWKVDGERGGEEKWESQTSPWLHSTVSF